MPSFFPKSHETAETFSCSTSNFCKCHVIIVLTTSAFYCVAKQERKKNIANHGQSILNKIVIKEHIWHVTNCLLPVQHFTHPAFNGCFSLFFHSLILGHFFKKCVKIICMQIKNILFLAINTHTHTQMLDKEHWLRKGTIKSANRTNSSIWRGTINS